MNTNLGPCCVCGTSNKVRNILMLHRLSPTPGKGWACLACNLPPNGAVAVVCDHCFKTYGENIYEHLRFVCTGYPAEDGRTPIAELKPDNFDHDRTGHPELAANN